MRLGAGGLLGDRDRAVVETLAKMRLATTAQLRALHFAEVSDPVCYRALNRLRRLDLISALTWHPDGSRRSIWNRVYQLGRLGRVYTNTNRRRVISPTDYGPMFAAHTLAITSVYVALGRLGPESQLVFTPEPECWRGDLRPDAYIQLVSGTFRYYWFIEMDMGTEPPNRIKQKLVAYARYWASGQEQRTNKIFPKVLFLVPDEARKQQVQTLINGSRARKLFRVELQTNAYHVITGGSSL